MWTRGAVLSRVSNKATVVSTQAVRHYGVTASYPFDSVVDVGRPTQFSRSGTVPVEKVRIHAKVANFIVCSSLTV